MLNDKELEELVLKATGARQVLATELIQNLWSNYGQLLRIQIEGSSQSSVILKHIKIPETEQHPRGFNTDVSRQRKIRSYQVEAKFYEEFNKINLTDSNSPTASCLLSSENGLESYILLEDLDASGFAQRASTVTLENVKVVLTWLASFHAKFMGVDAQELWPSGTYWHLETRPDELQVLASEDPSLRNAAHFIDQKLKRSQFQTLVHGDAKLANFCFSEDLSKVAAVDFQYVGGGCGMKDVAYFIGSCLDENESQRYENEILDFYFTQLDHFLSKDKFDFPELEREWRSLYHVAWADFHRFLKGWSPGHWKINSYSEQVSRKVQDEIQSELLYCAETAATEAGQLVRSYWKKDFEIKDKGGNSKAASIVTEVDLLSQKKILEILQPNIEKYNLGLLTEEENDDGSRLHKEYFWCIDPIDGTLPFSKGQTGFAVSIALISRSGDTLLSAIYDPAEQNFYSAYRKEPSCKNGKPIKIKNDTKVSQKIRLFADPSLQRASNYSELESQLDLCFEAGAVMKIIRLIEHGNACYFKYPKKEKGGCAIWDLAAVQLILEQTGGVLLDHEGHPLNFNNPDTIYFNHSGFIACSSQSVYAHMKQII